MSESWYALHVKPRFERYVTGQLCGKGYETFMPSYVSNRKWSDRVKPLTLPLFPGYVFCRFDVHARLPILVTPGVMTVVGIGKAPVAIEEHEILAIQRVVDSGLPTQRWPYLKCGESVRVEAGPLEGMTGIVVRMKGGDKLIVSVSLLMRSVSVEIDRAFIKPVGAHKPLANTALPVAEETHLVGAAKYSFR